MMAKPLTASEVTITEAAITRKLLFDGSTNDDTRILKFVNMFSNWCGMDASDKRHSSLFPNLRLRLDRLEYDARRSVLSIQAAEKIKMDYLALKKKIQEEIFLTKQQIAKHKRLNEEMQTAKNERIQYDHLLSLVRSKPDRKAVEFKVGKLKTEVDALQTQLTAVENTMAARKKQITALMQMAQDLSILLKEDNTSEQYFANGIPNTFVLDDLESEQKKNEDCEFLQKSLESISESSIIQNCTEIQSDEEMQDADAVQYVLQIKEPASEEKASQSETLFVVEAENENNFEDLLLLPDMDMLDEDIEASLDNIDKLLQDNLEFSLGSTVDLEESGRCSYFSAD